MQIAIIGTGYVGLTSGACLADIGNRVVCVDTDRDKISKINNGELPIYEPGLKELVLENVQKARLSFQTEIPKLDDFDAVYIAVGTPEDPKTGNANLKYVLDAAEGIAVKLSSNHTTVVIKSTVPPGTADKVRNILKSNANGCECTVVSNPELLKEGNAIEDFMKPARVIVGVSEGFVDTAIATMKKIYSPLLRGVGKFLVMDNRSAELAKYANNGMLAARISFMNEMSRVAEKVGADIDHVRAAVGSDPRIGPSFLFAGPGFGGSCFPKDVSAISAFAGIDTPVVDAVIETNLQQKIFLTDKVIRLAGSAEKVAIWGVSFKPDTDDVRESPANYLVEGLNNCNVNVSYYDPQGRIERAEYVPDPYRAAEGAECLVLVTEWSEFKQPDWKKLHSVMNGNIIVDGRNLWDPEEVRSAGFEYHGIGRAAT